MGYRGMTLIFGFYEKLPLSGGVGSRRFQKHPPVNILKDEMAKLETLMRP